MTPLSRVFAYEWQGKDLRDRECVRVANKGLTKPHFCPLVQRAIDASPWKGALEEYENKGPTKSKG